MRLLSLSCLRPPLANPPVGSNAVWDVTVTSQCLRDRISSYGLQPERIVPYLFEGTDGLASCLLPTTLIQEIALLRESMGDSTFQNGLVYLLATAEKQSIEHLIQSGPIGYLTQSLRTASHPVQSNQMITSGFSNSARASKAEMAASSGAPPHPAKESTEDDEVPQSYWDGISLKELKSYLISDRPQDIRKAALSVLMSRFDNGDWEAFLTLVECAERSTGARIKVHDIMAANDVAYFHLRRAIQQNKQLTTELFFAIRSLAGRIDDPIQERFAELIADQKMIPLSSTKLSYFNGIIDNLSVDDLGRLTADGSPDAAEELMRRYHQFRLQGTPEGDELAKDILIELESCVESNIDAFDHLLAAGQDGPFVWSLIDELAIEIPAVAAILAESVKEGLIGYHLESLRLAAMESPHAALCLCEAAEEVFAESNLQIFDAILVGTPQHPHGIMNLNLSRYHELAQQDPRAIEALVQLDKFGAKQARHQLALAAQSNPDAKKALDALAADGTP